MLEKLKNLKWRYLFAGAMISVIGLCFLFFSNSFVALTVTIGVIVALFGLAIGVFGILGKKRDFIFAVKLAIAIIFFAGGILTAIFNAASLETLISAICLLLIVDGTFKLQTSIKLKKYSIDGWWIMMTISVLVILSSFLLARIAPENCRAAVIWLGITVIFDASSNFLSSVWSARCRTAEKAEIYYEVYRDIENPDNK